MFCIVVAVHPSSVLVQRNIYAPHLRARDSPATSKISPLPTAVILLIASIATSPRISPSSLLRYSSRTKGAIMGQQQHQNGAPTVVQDLRVSRDKHGADASPLTASYRQGELIKLMVGDTLVALCSLLSSARSSCSALPCAVGKLIRFVQSTCMRAFLKQARSYARDTIIPEVQTGGRMIPYNTSVPLILLSEKARYIARALRTHIISMYESLDCIVLQYI